MFESCPLSFSRITEPSQETQKNRRMTQQIGRLCVICSGVDRLLLGLLITLVSLSQARAQSLSTGLLAYLPDDRNDVVWVLDLDAEGPNQEVARIPLGEVDGSSYVTVTPDGSQVYVSHHSSGKPSVIDTASNTVIARLESGSRGMVASPDGNFVYSVSGRVLKKFDTATHEKVGEKVFDAPPGVVNSLTTRMIAISSDGERLYVPAFTTFDNESYMFVFDSGSLTVSQPINLREGQDFDIADEPAFIAVHPNGSVVFSTEKENSRGRDTLVVANASSGGLIEAIFPPTSGDFGDLVVNHAGTRLFVQHSGRGGLVYDANDYSLLASRVGGGTRGIDISPDGRFVASVGGSGVDIIDAETFETVGRAIPNYGPDDARAGIYAWGNFLVSKVPKVAARAEFKPTTESGQALAFKRCVAAGSSAPNAVGFQPIPDQPQAGEFPAVPALPATPINCTLQFDVVARWQTAADLDLEYFIEIKDQLTNGLTYGGLLRSTVSNAGTTVSDAFFAATNGNNITFTLRNGLSPNGSVLRTFSVKIEYFVLLNKKSEESAFQQNRATASVFSINKANGTERDEANLNLGFVRIEDSTPAMECEHTATQSSGAIGDVIPITITVRNTGKSLLTDPQVDAVIPDNTTLVPGSVKPLAIVTGNRIQWRMQPDVNLLGSAEFEYQVRINASAISGQQLNAQAFLTAQAPLVEVPNFFARLNRICPNVVISVNPKETLALTLRSRPTQGWASQLIRYIATVENVGNLELNPVILEVFPGTEPHPTNPSFPLNIGPLAPKESRTIEYQGHILSEHQGTLIDTVIATATSVDENDNPIATDIIATADTRVRVLPPLISSVTPAASPAGVSNLELTIEGLCFDPGAIVTFVPSDGIEIIPPEPPKFGYEGPTELRRRIHIAANAPSGDVQVFVTNLNGESGGEEPYNLFHIGTSPRISRIEPISGTVDDTVTIFGGNFAVTPEENVVRFGDTEVTVMSASFSQLMVLIPSWLPETTLPVTVTAAGRTSNSVNFIFHGQNPPIATVFFRPEYFALRLRPAGLTYYSPNVFVIEENNPSIISITPTGISSELFSLTSLNVRWTDLIADSVGNLYAANFLGNEVLQVSPNGNSNAILLQAADSPAVQILASDISQPMGLAADSEDNVYASSFGEGIIYKITPSGEKSEYASGFSQPGPLKSDVNGGLYVGTQGDGGLWRIPPGGGPARLVAQLPNPPTSIVTDANGDLIIGTKGEVAEPNTATLLKVTPDGTVSTYATGFSTPVGLALDALGNLYVADLEENLIYRASPSDPSAQPAEVEVRLFSESLQFERATGEYAGAIHTLELTTGPLSEPANGELAPTESIVSDLFASTDLFDHSHGSLFRLEGVTFPGGAIGAIGVDLPGFESDINGDEFDYGFLDPAQSINQVSTKGDFVLFDEAGNVFVDGPATLTWDLDAGKTSGTCSIEIEYEFFPGIPPLMLRFVVDFHILDYVGTIEYTRLGDEVVGSVNFVRTGDAAKTLEGDLRLLRNPEEPVSFTVLPGDLSNESSQTFSYELADLELLNATVFSGSIYFQDGDPTTPFKDFSVWVLQIRDLSDSDGDRIPDIANEPPPATGQEN